MKDTLKKVAGNWILTIDGKQFINPTARKLLQHLRTANKRIKVVS